MRKNTLSFFIVFFLLTSLTTVQTPALADDNIEHIPLQLNFPEPLTPHLSVDGNTLFNGLPLKAVVSDPNPSTTLRRIPAPAALMTEPAADTASFTITYILNGGSDPWGETCYTFPEEAKTAFAAAANIWANTLHSNVPITISACWGDLESSSILGYSGGGPLHWNFTGATRLDTYYSGSLANALSGSDQAPASFDMHITYNQNFSWYYGTDGITPAGEYDLMTVVLHEIAHGLNFSGSMSYAGGVGSYGYGTIYPNIYDVFVQDGSGTQLITYTNGSIALGSKLVSNDIWFHGSQAMAANSNQPVKIYAPSTWSDGSSYSHLDYATFEGTANQLMVYAISAGESIHDPGAITRGLLSDLGWTTSSSITCIVDGDQDGYGTIEGTTVIADDGVCDTAQGESTSSDDCDDGDANIYPGATETVADGVDQDCNNEELCYADLDDDGYRPDGTSTTVSTNMVCTDSGEAVSTDPIGDCDDTDPATYPGATEQVCDGVDNDCDALVDEGRVDADGDGVDECSDCDDTDPANYPGNTELVCDGVDNDCDALVDEGRVDADSDGVDECSDCDDTDPANYPGNTELVCDGVDNDCDALVDEGRVDADSDGVDECSDCDDTDPANYPGNTELVCDGVDNDCDALVDEGRVDADGDGVDECSDCDDTDPANYPGNTELVCDGVDNDCDALVDEGRVDADSDGVDECSDCDDTDPAIYPGATELVCDGVNNDCDALVDEGRVDADSDGVDECSDCDDTDPANYPGNTELVCDGVDNDCDALVDEGRVDADSDGVDECSDCDDTDPAIYPGATELVCDGVDNDCDALVDEGRVDADSDGVDECSDCDDTDPANYPGNTELVCDGVDNDCDALVDEGRVDADSDGVDECSDCDDTDPAIYPGATELVCDGVDNDCDALVDEGRVDADSDGVDECSDCDDTDPANYPGNTELVCDGVDNDCDALVDEGRVDADSDGVDECSDCDDTDPAIYPGATELVCDGVDNDCDALVDEGRVNLDGDSADECSDCDDSDASIHPGAIEVVGDGIDQDCDGNELCYQDIDGDTYGTTTTIADNGDWTCNDTGESTYGDDCDDTNPSIYPGAAETADDDVDQDCNGHDTITCIVDGDQDGYGTSQGTTVFDPEGTCDTAQGQSTTSDDCNDVDASVHPEAIELCDNKDNDCDSEIDENGVCGNSFWLLMLPAILGESNISQ